MKDPVLRKVYKRTLIISFFIMGICFFIFDDPKNIIQGYLFGSIISVFGFILMERTLKRAMKMNPGKASGHTMLHFFLRYIIYFTVLIVAAIADYLNFPATALGLSTIKFVILFSTFFDKSFMK